MSRRSDRERAAPVSLKRSQIPERTFRARLLERRLLRSERIECSRLVSVTVALAFSAFAVVVLHSQIAQAYSTLP